MPQKSPPTKTRSVPGVWPWRHLWSDPPANGQAVLLWMDLGGSPNDAHKFEIGIPVHAQMKLEGLRQSVERYFSYGNGCFWQPLPDASKLTPKTVAAYL